MRVLVVLACAFSVGNCVLRFVKPDVVSNVTEGLCAIIKSLNPPQLVVLTTFCGSPELAQTYCHESKDFLDFIKLIHQHELQIVIFTDQEDYFNYVRESVLASMKIVSLIFDEPYELSYMLKNRTLAHRVSLFIFYYGEIGLPKEGILLDEPLRLAVISRQFPDS